LFIKWKLHVSERRFLINFKLIKIYIFPDYKHGIRLLRENERGEPKVLITFNARNKTDQEFFCKDLLESIREVNFRCN
jgi:hypothetical protein